MTTTQPRDPRGLPTGGRFAASAHAEATIALPARHDIAGYDLRSLRLTGGNSWTALIYRHGVATLAISDDGSLDGLSITALDDPDAEDAYRDTARFLLDGDDGTELAMLLRHSADIDRTARAEQLDRSSVIESLVYAGTIEPRHYLLLA